jgi:hypothetical protein
MSVSSELLCSFELLKPLDSNALKSHIKKGRNKRNNMLNSPVSFDFFLFLYSKTETDVGVIAGWGIWSSECMRLQSTVHRPRWNWQANGPESEHVPLMAVRDAG